MRAAGRIVLLWCSFAACTVIGGGHWATLQAVAWARMTVDYTVAAGSLQRGLAQTFDGEHPCELCSQIKAGVEKERRDEGQKPGKEQEFGKLKQLAVIPGAFLAPFSSSVIFTASFSEVCAGRAPDAPPVPPPRVD